MRGFLYVLVILSVGGIVGFMLNQAIDPAAQLATPATANKLQNVIALLIEERVGFRVSFPGGASAVFFCDHGVLFGVKGESVIADDKRGRWRVVADGQLVEEVRAILGGCEG